MKKSAETDILVTSITSKNGDKKSLGNKIVCIYIIYIYIHIYIYIYIYVYYVYVNKW